MEIEEASLPTMKREANSPLALAVLGGMFFAIMGSILLCFQCQRLSKIRRCTEAKREKRARLLSCKEIEDELRGTYRQSYQELSDQLQQMKKMQRDVKGQLGGLQSLARKLSKKPNVDRNNPIKQQSSKKGN